MACSADFFYDPLEFTGLAAYLPSNCEGRVRLKIVLKKDGNDILTKEYSVQKNCGINMVAKAESYAKTLELTLQEVMKEIVPDINAAINR